MCGITGFWQSDGFSANAAKAVASGMANRIDHRGPDDSGVWLDESFGVALAHRRLSIVDLSAAGHQPMCSATGRYVIAFNGEIYNHLDIRNELQGDGYETSRLLSHSSECWRGHSDTETLLAGIEYWGIAATLTKSVGMFAIALWDSHEQVLTLARDRIGEKPLYYGFQNGTFLFGSELKAVKAHPDFLGEIDRDVLCLYLRHCYIPAPYSIYKGIKKLLPGTYLQVKVGSGSSVQPLTPKEYWSMTDAVLRGVADPFTGGDAEAIASLDRQLKQAIGLQMTADVPLGAFLSGGVDSSTVVAVMQALSMRPIKTFSIGFTEAGYNEADYAKAVARHLGTEHTELYMSSVDALKVIPLLGEMYDEPFADSSQIPTFLVSKLARNHVTVALSGDGGDELFGGYNRAYIMSNWGSIEKIPFWARRLTGCLVRSVTQNTLDIYTRKVRDPNPKMVNIGDRLAKFGSRLETLKSLNDLIHSLASVIDCPADVVIGAVEPVTWLKSIGANLDFNTPEIQMMLIAAKTYLPDDILVKVDRAAMANSLETRVPLLDHRLVELASRMPMSLKIRDGKTKWILRQVLFQYVPQHLIERAKVGFSIPLADWLRGSLREWASELLDEHRLRREGFFDAEFVHALWVAHLAGKHNNQSILWNILMFQAWLEVQ